MKKKSREIKYKSISRKTFFVHFTQSLSYEKLPCHRFISFDGFFFFSLEFLKILPVQFFDSSNGIRSRSGVFKENIIPNTIHVLLLLVTVLRCRSNGRHVERIHCFTNLFLETILLLKKLFSQKNERCLFAWSLSFFFTVAGQAVLGISKLLRKVSTEEITTKEFWQP